MADLKDLGSVVLGMSLDRESKSFVSSQKLYSYTSQLELRMKSLKFVIDPFHA